MTFQKISKVGRDTFSLMARIERPILFVLVLLSLSGCAGDSSLLGLLGASEEEIQAYQEDVDAFNATVEALPTVTIRILNETPVVALVSLQAGLSGLPSPESDFLGFDPFFTGLENDVTGVDFRDVLVSANGEVTGELKCGEVMTITAHAPIGRQNPFSQVSFDALSEDAGLYVDVGNVAFSGLGETGSDFVGDTISLVRLLRPADHGINCETSTIVIRIQGVATVDVFSDQTGELLMAGSPGSGVIEIE
ncbi:MAG: hypothetical protein AABZ47_05940 [Planctomycetota bacterium]